MTSDATQLQAAPNWFRSCFSAEGLSRLAWSSDVSDLLAVPRGDVAVSAPSDLCVSSRSSSSSEKSGSNSSMHLYPNSIDMDNERNTACRATSQSYLGQIIKDARAVASLR